MSTERYRNIGKEYQPLIPQNKRMGASKVEGRLAGNIIITEPIREVPTKGT